jgi:hypothetical protein
MTLEELVEELRKMGLKTTAFLLSYLERGVDRPKTSQAPSPVSAKVDLLVGCSKVFRVDPEWFLLNHQNIIEVLPDDVGVVWTESLSLDDVFVILGLNLRQIRKERRRTQKNLAEAMIRNQGFQIVEQRISQIENPKLDRLHLSGQKK